MVIPPMLASMNSAMAIAAAPWEPPPFGLEQARSRRSANSPQGPAGQPEESRPRLPSGMQGAPAGRDKIFPSALFTFIL